MLKDHEKSAVYSILVRQIEAQDLKAMADKEAAAATERATAAQAVMSNIRPALSVFGFDPASPRLWDLVKEAIGEQAYYSAFRVARGEQEVDQKETSTGYDEAENANADSNVTPSPQSDVDISKAPKIKELVLERLRQSGDNGILASEIKEFVAAQGIETHEKTVGMTLYRLSKEGQVSRIGRTWFYAEKQDDGGKDDPAEDCAANVSSAGSVFQ